MGFKEKGLEALCATLLFSCTEGTPNCGVVIGELYDGTCLPATGIEHPVSSADPDIQTIDTAIFDDNQSVHTYTDKCSSAYRLCDDFLDFGKSSGLWGIVDRRSIDETSGYCLLGENHGGGILRFEGSIDPAKGVSRFKKFRIRTKTAGTEEIRVTYEDNPDRLGYFFGSNGFVYTVKDGLVKIRCKFQEGEYEVPVSTSSDGFIDVTLEQDQFGMTVMDVPTGRVLLSGQESCWTQGTYERVTLSGDGIVDLVIGD